MTYIMRDDDNFVNGRFTGSKSQDRITVVNPVVYMQGN
jgi:hypothetical protein